MSARVRSLAAALVTVALLGACSTSDEDASNDVSGQGYVSGDGGTAIFAADDRKGPVELKGTDYAGKEHDVTTWQGDVVVVNTWYANCPPCRAEAPDLVALANDYASKGVHVIGVNGTDSAAPALAFQKKFDVPYPSIHDTDGSAIASLQGVIPINAVPTTVVLDRDGDVAARILGTARASTLTGIVDDVLAEGS